ncbi:hypothetical protein B0H19DRAFT_1287148 [Mycena capillaripes]|nr:hypothetical protein B0H19DRAFT_1287148 [Mycena capillaripes]
MPELGRFSCWVEVNDVRLSEYSPENSADGEEATCWIPSEVDKVKSFGDPGESRHIEFDHPQKFSIHWIDSNASSTRRVYGSVSVDGIDCGGRELSLVRAGGRWLGTGHRDSVSISPTTRRSLLFGRQQFTDDDRFLDASISPDLGTIGVEFAHVFERNTPAKLRQFVSLPPQKLHEQSKKIRPEFRSPGPSSGAMHSTSEVEVLKTLAKFTFKYRPLDLLKANGIAPADRSRPRPKPAAIEVIPDEDEEAIASQIKVLQEKLAAVRKKPQRPSNGIKKEVKAETSFFLER